MTVKHRVAHAPGGNAAVVLQDEDLGDDRRWAPRRTGVLGANIISDRLQSSVFCVVRDLSSTGALLELRIDKHCVIGSATDLPNSFKLILRNDAMDVDCEVAWRRRDTVGVRFLGGLRQRTKAPKGLVGKKKR